MFIFTAKLLIRDNYLVDMKKQIGFKYSVYGITERGKQFLNKAQRNGANDIWEMLTTDMYRILKCSKPSQ